MGASEGMPIISLRTLNTVTVTLALGLVALAGWHVQNPGHFEQIQVFNPSCAFFVLWRPLCQELRVACTCLLAAQR